jgi:hypothetical protein
MSKPKITDEQAKRFLTAEDPDEISEEEIDKRMRESGLTDNDRQQALARDRLRFEEAVAERKKAAREKESASTTSRLVRWVQAALLVFGLGSGTAVATGIAVLAKVQQLAANIPTATSSGTNVPPPVDKHHEHAEMIRYEGLKLYVDGQYQSCIENLDAAKNEDPWPEDPTITRARKQALEALGKKGP